MKNFDGATAHHFDQLHDMLLEMRSLSIEGRSLWQEFHYCDDHERRAALWRAYREVQHRWRLLTAEHAAMYRRVPIW